MMKCIATQSWENTPCRSLYHWVIVYRYLENSKINHFDVHTIIVTYSIYSSSAWWCCAFCECVCVCVLLHLFVLTVFSSSYSFLYLFTFRGVRRVTLWQTYGFLSALQMREMLTKRIGWVWHVNKICTLFLPFTLDPKKFAMFCSFLSPRVVAFNLLIFA